MRYVVIVAFLLVLGASVAYAASLGVATFNAIGAGTDTVPHCQVLDYDIAALDTISSVNARVKCDVTGSYTVNATVTSGVNSGSGQAAASLTANTPLVVAIAVSPSVAIGGATYSADLQVVR